MYEGSYAFWMDALYQVELIPLYSLLLKNFINFSILSNAL
jgi:hypothetical protein